MKHIPKYTPTEVLNDPYGFTYKEMSEVIGEDKHRLTRAHREKQLKMSCQALHNAPPNRT